jgi:hypothetical protein
MKLKSGHPHVSIPKANDKHKKTYGVVPQEERKNRLEKSSDYRGIADCGKRPGERVTLETESGI